MRNYKKLDSMVRFCYKEDLYQDVSNLGCKYVSEVVCSSLDANAPVRDIAILFNVNMGTVNYWKKKWGIPRGDHGGNRCNRAMMNPKNIEKIKSLKGVVSSSIAAKGLCSSSAVRVLWIKMKKEGNK